MNGIEIKNVSKQYKNVAALDDVTLTFAPGKIYGLLGRNGAGKTTLLNIIASRIFASGGTVTIDGENAVENMRVHDKIFCMSEQDLYSPALRVRDHFKWTARFYDGFDLERAHEIAALFGLDERKKFKALSKGYQSIFKLTIALALDVPYVIFDEPVLGLDANNRELFYKLLLEKYEREGNTLILATHLIEEVANLIEEVVLIDHGKVLLSENVEVLLSQGYTVSGFASDVDLYCADKRVIGVDNLGGLKLAYVLGERTPAPEGVNLQFTSLNLQKLFVKLTEAEEGEQWAS